MERQFPKNVKQIGNVSDSPRIYVEDYVETFLNQLEEQGREVTITAFLLGEKVQIEGEECIFVTGALQVKDSILEEIAPVITKEELETAKVESREYFHEMDIIGWFQTVPDRPLALSREMAKAHEKLMPEKNSLLILKGQEEELYFAYKFKELMEIGGHYIFYEKNPDMQSYMIRERRQIGVTPSEVVEDRAAKDFRSTIKGRMEVREQRRESRYVYLTSVLLVVIVLAIGISTMNNYDKMNSVQNSIETLSSNMGANGSSGKMRRIIRVHNGNAEPGCCRIQMSRVISRSQNRPGRVTRERMRAELMKHRRRRMEEPHRIRLRFRRNSRAHLRIIMWYRREIPWI